MGRRLRPTKGLVLSMCGEKSGLLSSVHHGLSEVSLKDFYPHLNFEEVVAFAIGSWNARNHDLADFRGFLKGAKGTYDVFSMVNDITYPELKRSQRMNGDLKGKYARLNPFRGRSLELRLARVGERAVKKLFEELNEETNEYVFECDYRGNRGLVLMRFQTAFPRSGKVAPNYAAEISRLARDYPQEYEPLEDAQRSLF